MSWRHPERTKPSAKTQQNASSVVFLRSRKCEKALIRHLRDLMGMVALQEALGFFQAKLGIDRLNAEEKAVAAGANEVRRVKHRMVGLRQTVKREHSEYSSQRSSQH